MKRASLLSLFVLCATLSACRGFDVEAPEGFAAYDHGRVFRAVSPEGLMFRVRKADNEPKAELPFWREAMKKRMTDAGYRFISEGDIKSASDAGYLIELAAPLGQQDFTYLIALFQKGSNLYIVESAGEVAAFAKRRQAVVDAVGKLKI